MRIGINKKLLGSFIAGTIFAMVFIGWSFITIERLTSAIRQMEDMTLRVDTTADLNFLIQKLLKTSDDYLITGDITKRDEFDRLTAETADIINFLDKGKGDEKWNRMSKKVRDGALRLSEMTIEIMHIDNPVGNPQGALLRKGATMLAEGLIADVEEFNKIASEDRDALGEKARKFAGSAREIVYIFPVIGILLLFFLYRYLIAYISRPLTELYKGAEKLSRGDFSHRVNVKTGDELEDLSEGFNRMAEALKERETRLMALLKVVDRLNIELMDERHHKTAFLRNISHELKTPLTHILGFSELLKELDVANNAADKVERYAGNIFQSGKELLRLVEELLEASLVTSGRAALDLEEFNAGDAVRDAVDMVMPMAERKAQKFKADIGGGVEKIRADRAMFSQMLFNLLDNAVKYTPVGGTVDLRVSQDSEKDIKVLRVRVKDTGIGIKPQFKDAIFDFFEMGDKSFVREHEGLGVGLALTKRLVEFHGGRIWFTSEPGKGSVFEFFIPVGSVGKGG